MRARLAFSPVCFLAVSLLSVAVAQTSIDAQELYLEAHINSTSTGLIGRFVARPDGSLLANAQELHELGLKTDGLTPDANGDVSVDHLSGVVYRVDHASQSIYFEVQTGARATKVIDVSAPENYLPEVFSSEMEDGQKEELSRGFGAVLNYSLQAETGMSGTGRKGSAAYFGNFSSRIFTPVGALNHGFSYSDAVGYRRHESYWRTPFAKNAVQLQLGDMITRGPVWSHPVRLGGIQIERNYALRPDIVRTPLPSYSGTAAVPTTVDVFDGSIRRYSADVPAGPFELTNLPFSTGVNEATVVLRDASGQAVSQDITFLVSSDLLSAGTADYSMSLGYPRIGIGTDSDRYQTSLFGAASFRIGITDSLTLSAHAEGGDELSMLGIGSTFRVGTLGTVSLSHARSTSDMGDGALYDLSARARKGRLSVSGRIMRADDTFTDIARQTTTAAGSLDDFLLDYSTAKSLDQLSIGYSMAGNWTGIQAVYAANERLDGTDTRSFGLSSSFRIGEAGSLNISALATEGDASDMLVGASLYFPLGERRSAYARMYNRDGQTSYAAGLSKSRDPNKDEWDWRMDVVRDARTSVNLLAGRQLSSGRLEFAARGDGGDAVVGMRAEGAVVLAGGGLFLSERIDDSFAIVDAGAPGVEVQVENRPAGKTGRSGKALVPDLRSYERNSISINIDTLPIEAEVPSVNEVIVPAYNTGVTLDFNVDTNPSNAVIYLKLPSGDPVPVGLNATLESGADPFIVGYDGMVYLSGLDAKNVIHVTKPDGWRCSAQFTYKAQPGTVTDLGEVICQ